MAGQTDSVDTPNPEYLEMAESWNLVDTLLGGTKRMREAAQKYLPQEPAESDAAYKHRLNRSYLFEGYKRSVETLIGRPLMETVSFTNEMGDDFQDWMNDVNLQGVDINAFTREVFFSAVHHGLTHILVDYPRSAGPQRLDQQRRAKLRPYGVHLPAKDVIAWRTESKGHLDVLSHLRFKRVVKKREGNWSYKEVEQIYVMDLNHDPDKDEMIQGLSEENSFVLLRVYEQNDAGEWDLIDDPEVLTIPEIPLVTIYANRKGFMISEPTLMGVADLNVAHWQSASDQRNILHVCRVPILFGKHLSTKTTGDGDEILDFEIGINRLIHSDHENGDLKYVEHTGAAISAGEQDLENLKDEMTTLALEVMTKRSGNVTATEKAIDSASANGPLVGMVRALQTGLNKMLKFMGMWSKREDYGMVDVNTDFRIAIDNADLETLWKARLNGDITVETFWNECLRRGVLNEDFDADTEKKALQKEKEENDLPTPPNPGSAFGQVEDEEEEVE